MLKDAHRLAYFTPCLSAPTPGVPINIFGVIEASASGRSLNSAPFQKKNRRNHVTYGVGDSSHIADAAFKIRFGNCGSTCVVVCVHRPPSVVGDTHIHQIDCGLYSGSSVGGTCAQFPIHCFAL